MIYNELDETLVSEIVIPFTENQVPFYIQLTTTLLTIRTLQSTQPEEFELQVINSPNYLYELFVTTSIFENKTRFSLVLNAYNLINSELQNQVFSGSLEALMNIKAT